MRTIQYMSAAAGLAIVAAAPVVTGSARQPVFNAPADVAEITAIEHTLATELDIDKVLPLYAEDATVLDLFSPGVFRGKAEIRAGFGPQLAAIKSIDVTAPEVTIATNGNFGCAISQMAYQTLMKDGKSFAMNVRVLDALKKIDGKWRVVQQHMSFPIDPATMTAQTSAPIQPRTVAWSAQPLAPLSTTPETAKKEIADFYGSIMGSYNGITLSMPLFAADSDRSFGVQIDTQQLTLAMKDGSTRKIALGQSDCMRREGGKWFSFLEMISYPVDVTTMKAQMTF